MRRESTGGPHIGLLDHVAGPMKASGTTPPSPEPFGSVGVVAQRAVQVGFPPTIQKQRLQRRGFACNQLQKNALSRFSSRQRPWLPTLPAQPSSTSSDRSPGFAPAPSDTSAKVPGLNEGMINPGNRYLG